MPKLKKKKEAILSQGTKGDSDKSFRDRVVKIYGNLPRASQSYSLPTGNSGSIDLDDSVKGESGFTDLEIFSRLYNPGQLAQTTGNGELSLWWLFNCSNDVYDKVNPKGGFSPRCLVNQGGDDQADPDLRIGTGENAIYMEIKSLPKGAWSKTNSLGRFGRFTDFIDLVGLLQSFENTFGENNLPGGVKTLKNISYGSLVDSAEVFCEVRSVVKSNNLGKYKFFGNLVDKFDRFDDICDKHEILRKCKYGGNVKRFRPGGEEIAKRLLGFVAITAFKEKPGYGNWMVNVPSEGGLKSVECFKPLEANFRLDKIKVTANFKIDNGAIKLKFLEMFS